ncbi:MAG: GyrI-like domain-containing protein [Anaerolineae bacterium]
MFDESTVFPHGNLPFEIKVIEPQLVACVRFRGLLNVASSMWILRDWAKRKGCTLIGPPSCVFGLGGEELQQTPCEIQWAVSAPVSPTDAEIVVKWLARRTVLAACHRGNITELHTTIEALRVWAHAQGYQTTGERREVYHSNVKVPKEDRVTEIQLYVEADSRKPNPIGFDVSGARLEAPSSLLGGCDPLFRGRKQA